jgi:hypothetical protein
MEAGDGHEVGADGAHVLVARALAAAAAVCVVAVLSACGGGSGSVSPDSVANAATKTSNVKSYRVSTATSLKLPSTSRKVTFLGTGVYDPGGRRGRLELDLSQLNQVLGPTGSPYNFGHIQMIMAGSDLYMRIPFLKQVEPSIRPWIKIDLNHASQAAGFDFSSFLQFGQGGDPTQTLQYLRGAGKVKKVGSEDVRGVKTTHYRATVDLRRVAAKAPAKDRAALRRATQRLIALTGEKTLPVEIWVDDHGLVRRESYREKLAIQNSSTELASSMELYDFGAPVVAPVPSKSLVTDLSGLASRS